VVDPTDQSSRGIADSSVLDPADEPT